MLESINQLWGTHGELALLIGGIVAAVAGLVAIWVVLYYGAIWLPAYMSGADVSFLNLVAMSFRQISPATIVAAKIMGVQAGLNIDREGGMSTAQMEAHVLAGGNILQVVRAIIAAQRAGLNLEFSRAAAIDLAGRDVFEAVRISVFPKVIDCPNALRSGSKTLSAVAKNGVELRIHARVTVRTNLDQLVGGATEETIIARVGQGILTAIGGATTHMEVIATPDRISKSVLAYGLGTDTAYEIVSIDIAQIDVGENIGARLQTDQAEANMRMARAYAEQRRSAGVATEQEMKAKVAANQAAFVLAEAEIPRALAAALRAGRLYTRRTSRTAEAIPSFTTFTPFMIP